MFLKRIELFGFKSFAEKCTIDLSEELSVIVGPNGCGKSNVVDAIRWVLGTQSAKTMRSDKMASVIFNGNANRSPLNVAQVILVISNDDNLLPLEFSEVAIKRRVYRNGISEYFINDAQVSLKELRLTFLDTGISISEYLVLEQGKIDHILQAKPEERRKILEEAAGISKFRVSREEGVQRLEKVDANIGQLEQLLHEVVQRYDILKIQSEKARKYKELQDIIFLCNVTVACSQYEQFEQELKKHKMTFEQYHGKKQEAEKILQELIENDEQLDTQLKKEEQVILKFQNVLMEMQAEKRVLKEYISSLEKNEQDHKTHISQFEERITMQQNRIKERQQSLHSYNEEKENHEHAIVIAQKQITQLKRRETDAKERILALQKMKEDLIKKETMSRESVARLQKELRAVVDTLAEELDKHTSDSFSTQEKMQEDLHLAFKRLLHKIHTFTTRLSDNSLVQKTFEITDIIPEMQTLQALAKTISDDFNIFCDTLPRFLHDFMKEGGVLTRKHSIDENIQEESTAIIQNAQKQRNINDSLLKLDSELTTIVEMLQNYKIQMESYTQALKYAKEQIEKGNQDIAQEDSIVRSSSEQLLREKELLKTLLLNIETRRKTFLSINEKEKYANVQIEMAQSKIGNQNESLITFKRKISKQEETISVIRNAEYDIQSKIDRVSLQMQLLQENFYSVHGVQLHAYINQEKRIEGTERSRKEIVADIEKYKTELRNIGSVNLLAAEEFIDVEKRRNFLEAQLEDLQKSKDNLKTVLHDIQVESEKKLRITYNEVRKEFKSLFRSVMSGGKADIIFTDEEDILHAGLEIIAQPGNKKTNLLSQLSGGERAMTAIILIFSLYAVKPAPFCVLDEIDAPLDDSNIDRFMLLLQNYVHRIQFLIISHNKRSIAHAKSIIGISMEEMGVSSLIHVKVTHEEAK